MNITAVEIAKLRSKTGLPMMEVKSALLEAEGDEEAAIEILRKEKSLGNGKIVNLQHNKKNVTVVTDGKECGLLVDAQTEIQIGDRIVQK